MRLPRTSGGTVPQVTYGLGVGHCLRAGEAGAGGESVQFSIYRTHSYPFAEIQETHAPQARAVRRTSRALVPIRVQSSCKYGPEYGRKRSTEDGISLTVRPLSCQRLRRAHRRSRCLSGSGRQTPSAQPHVARPSLQPVVALPTDANDEGRFGNQLQFMHEHQQSYVTGVGSEPRIGGAPRGQYLALTQSR
jgi:hypothetical protein